MSVSSEHLVQPLARLTDCKNLADVLATAMDYEQTVFGFYAGLSPRVHEECRPMVSGLAQETAATLAELKRLAADPELADHLEHCVKRPESCAAFEQYADPPTLADDALDDDILQYTLDLERVAFEHYSALFEQTPDGAVTDLFAQLAKMKLRRLESLEDRWSKLYTCIPV